MLTQSGGVGPCGGTCTVTRMLKSVLVQLAPLSNQVVENWRLVDESQALLRTVAKPLTPARSCAALTGGLVLPDGGALRMPPPAISHFPPASAAASEAFWACRRNGQ